MVYGLLYRETEKFEKIIYPTIFYLTFVLLFHKVLLYRKLVTMCDYPQLIEVEFFNAILRSRSSQAALLNSA